MQTKDFILYFHLNSAKVILNPASLFLKSTISVLAACPCVNALYPILWLLFLFAVKSASSVAWLHCCRVSESGSV